MCHIPDGSIEPQSPFYSMYVTFASAVTHRRNPLTRHSVQLSFIAVLYPPLIDVWSFFGACCMLLIFPVQVGPLSPPDDTAYHDPFLVSPHPLLMIPMLSTNS